MNMKNQKWIRFEVLAVVVGLFALASVGIQAGGDTSPHEPVDRILPHSSSVSLEGWTAVLAADAVIEL
jgi:hypothetical protein